jgi:glycosyltransferase involved in cell wall biosynthesis
MTISVALCTYNGERYIRHQLDSILHQTIKPDEIVICDDVSSDSTMQILEEYKQNHPDIFRIHRNEVNLKSNKNFQKSVSLCTGDYIFCADHDDVWKTDKVEKILAVFKADASLEGVFSNAELIDGNGNVYENTSLWDQISFNEALYPKPVNLFEIINRKGNIVTGATLCIKKEVKDFIFPFPDSKDIYHDEWIALLLAYRKTLAYTTEKLIQYRIHSGQQVGAEMNRNEQKASHEDEILSGRKQAVSFSDHKLFSRMYYRNYLKYKQLVQTELSGAGIDFNAELNKNLEGFLATEKKLGRLNPFLYYSRRITDFFKGKRKL